MSDKTFKLIFEAIAAIEMLAAGHAAIQRIVQNLRSSLAAMQVERRDPSEAEWASIDAEITAALAQLKR